MQKTTFYLLILFLLPTISIAQVNVAGKIRTESGDPAEFVNVILRQSVDSNAVKIELSDERGNYKFKDIEAGDYLIQVTGLGYAEYYGEVFQVNEINVERPTIQIMEQAALLDQVEVVAKKPFLEQRAGKLVVNVDQSITGKGGSVTELLKKVPGVIVINDRISMAGRSGVTILIDGRPTRYMDIQSLLREMPADNILRIEVITQPGAAFDAEGTGGVINIVLKKNQLYGTNGNVTLGAGYGQLWKYRAGVNLSHRNGPLNISGSAGYSHRTWFERLNLTRRLPDLTFEQENYEPGLPHTVYGRLGIDYDLNSKHRIGIAGFGQTSNNDRTNTSSTLIFDGEGNLIQDFTTFNEQDRSWQNYSGDAYYQFRIDTSGQELSLDFNIAGFERSATSLQTTVGEDYDDRLNDEPANTNILAAKIDYKKPIGEHLEISAGGKYSRARLDNELRASLRPNGEWIDDIGLSNRFLYDEDIYAAYLSFAYKKGDWEANVGLRYEDTQTEGYSVTLDETNIRDFSQLFPSVSVNMPFIGPLGASLAYSYRIERPSYYSLNPFVSYLDPFTFQRGNPFLRPELTHSFQASLTYEDQPFFNLSYDRTNDVIQFVTEQNDETGEAFATDVNLDSYTRIGGSLFFPLDFIADPISGYGGVMIYHHDYESNYLGGEYQQDRTSVTAFLQANFKLPAEIKMEITGWLQGAGIDGIMRHETLYGVDVGVQKKFLNDKLRVQVSADGVIQKFFNATVRYQNMDFDIVSSWEAPTVDLRLTYSFGNQSLKKNERRQGGADDEKRRARINE